MFVYQANCLNNDLADPIDILKPQCYSYFLSEDFSSVTQDNNYYF